MCVSGSGAVSKTHSLIFFFSFFFAPLYLVTKSCLIHDSESVPACTTLDLNHHMPNLAVSIHWSKWWVPTQSCIASGDPCWFCSDPTPCRICPGVRTSPKYHISQEHLVSGSAEIWTYLKLLFGYRQNAWDNICVTNMRHSTCTSWWWNKLEEQYKCWKQDKNLQTFKLIYTI